jgi:phenylacetate-CoA ligase
MVQKSLQEIEVRLVVNQDLTAQEQATMISALQESLGYPFRIFFTYHQEIPRGAGGKYEDFISELGREG